MGYQWPHLKETLKRGQILYDALKPHLKSGDRILDAACGYSPLAGPLLREGYCLAGFDNNYEAVKHLEDAFPEGSWLTETYAQASYSGFTVLLLLGTTGLIYLNPKAMSDYRSFLERALSVLNGIRIILLDTAKGPEPPTEPWQLLYAETVKILSGKSYTNVLGRGSYDAPHPRSYLLVGKK